MNEFIALLKSFFSHKPKPQKENTESDKIVDQIKGFDLKIDPSVQSLCQVYNSSSGSTRRVIYILLIINVLSLMAVINTHKFNWTATRIDVRKSKIDTLEKHLQQADSAYQLQQWEIENQIGRNLSKTPRTHNDFLRPNIDSARKMAYFICKQKYDGHARKITDSIRDAIYEKEAWTKNSVENLQTVRVPILGYSFDVDNLAVISGISFIILLVVLRFTLTREKSNLRIALYSISERYTNENIAEEAFNINLDRISSMLNIEKTELIIIINRKRREYHYNFLSMNEVFNMPKLKPVISEQFSQRSFIGKIVRDYIFSFPFVIYLLVFGNDIITWKAGYDVSPVHTQISFVLSIICFIAISILCEDCNTQKQIINGQFDSFREEEKYIYKKFDYPELIGGKNTLTKLQRTLIIPIFPLIFLAKMGIEFFYILKPNDKKDSVSTS